MLVGLMDSGTRDEFINRIADVFAVDSPLPPPDNPRSDISRDPLR